MIHGVLSNSHKVITLYRYPLFFGFLYGAPFSPDVFLIGSGPNVCVMSKQVTDMGGDFPTEK